MIVFDATAALYQASSSMVIGEPHVPLNTNTKQDKRIHDIINVV